MLRENHYATGAEGRNLMSHDSQHPYPHLTVIMMI